MRRELEKRAIVLVLHRNPSWSLADVAELIERGDARARALGAVTIADLSVPADPAFEMLVEQRQRLELARVTRLVGPAFDAAVLEIVADAWPNWVAASYIRARAGGPRWKLQSSLGRLLDAGSLERTGVTSATKYRVPAKAKGRVG